MSVDSAPLKAGTNPAHQGVVHDVDVGEEAGVVQERAAEDALRVLADVEGALVHGWEGVSIGRQGVRK